MKNLAINISSPLFKVPEESFKKFVRELKEMGFNLHAFHLVASNELTGGPPPRNADHCESFVQLLQYTSIHPEQPVHNYYTGLNSPIPDGQLDGILGHATKPMELTYTFKWDYICSKCESVIRSSDVTPMTRAEILRIKKSYPASDTIEYTERRVGSIVKVTGIDGAESCRVC